MVTPFCSRLCLGEQDTQFWVNEIQGEFLHRVSGKDSFSLMKRRYGRMLLSCLQRLWQPLCDHEGKAKIITEKLTQIFLRC